MVAWIAEEIERMKGDIDEVSQEVTAKQQNKEFTSKDEVAEESTVTTQQVFLLLTSVVMVLTAFSFSFFCSLLRHSCCTIETN